MKAAFLLLFFVHNIVLGQTKIEGNINSFPNTAYAIKTDQTALNDYNGITIASGTTDDKGLFSATIDSKKEQPVILFIGNRFFSLWTKPNTVMGITENTDKQYVFSGATATENNILYTSGLMQPFRTPGNIGLTSFNAAKQIAYLDSIESRRLQILSSPLLNNDVSATFKVYYKAEIQGYSFFNKSQYIGLLKATNVITDKDVPGDYFNFWASFELANDTTASNTYQNALQDYIEYIALKKTGKNQTGKEQAWREMFRVADSLLQEYPLSLQKQKTRYLSLLIKYFNFDELTVTEIAIYRKQFPRSVSLLLLDDLWIKKKGVTAILPDFKLKNERGHIVDIKDFRGKVIYIDFWGAWCKACLINMPYARKLKEKFKNKDVVFLYIDFFDTEEKWSGAIKQYNIAGIHLKAEQPDEAYFNKVFNIDQGFPRYALIGKTGKLVTISAPQPQDEAAYNLIQKYLEE